MSCFPGREPQYETNIERLFTHFKDCKERVWIDPKATNSSADLLLRFPLNEKRHTKENKVPHYIKLCVPQKDLAGGDHLRETITVKLLSLAWLHLDRDQNVRALRVSGKCRHKCQPHDVFSCGVALRAGKLGWQIISDTPPFSLWKSKTTNSDTSFLALRTSSTTTVKAEFWHFVCSIIYPKKDLYVYLYVEISADIQVKRCCLANQIWLRPASLHRKYEGESISQFIYLSIFSQGSIQLPAEAA